MEFIKYYITATAIFVAIDAVWLSIVAKNFYKNNIGHLMATKPNFKPAVIFYALYIIGIVYFAVSQQSTKHLLAMH
jgi:uncharacterized membrane protein